MAHIARDDLNRVNGTCIGNRENLVVQTPTIEQQIVDALRILSVDTHPQRF